MVEARIVATIFYLNNLESLGLYCNSPTGIGFGCGQEVNVSPLTTARQKWVSNPNIDTDPTEDTELEVYYFRSRYQEAEYLFREAVAILE